MKRYSNSLGELENINMANVLMLLSQSNNDSKTSTTNRTDERRLFECKTCNRRFPSFQALGGHRASHKKPKLSVDDSNKDLSLASGNKPKAHECSICGLEFGIGQALGGHMRRHRRASEGFRQAFVKKIMANNEGKRVVLLDLNLPPSDDDDDDDDEMECKKPGE
ncbi:uncharacterized protein A4U43_C05F3690 [Asparagus officinalis]|uniref:C2H2-type domain-containing protein n=1 Tax=Asparagus officinalis TaxID=4686 RepID=A0A5P1EST6_ASPOF|nr:zinc finger protein ZAT11-like [Asparagus officinalis]ONK67779.1 uncharacterized protein A4U43_C05F3690 [Asparagus officinalis]